MVLDGGERAQAELRHWLECPLFFLICSRQAYDCPSTVKVLEREL